MSIKLDPRIKRTRLLLQQAINALMGEKEFHNITVQDITARAEVNRATFYAHFEDKYALLNYSVREEFLVALAKRSSQWDVYTPTHLRSLIMVVYEFLSLFSGRCPSHGGPQSEDKLFVLSEVQKQVRVILLAWLQPFASSSAYPSCEAAVMIASWAIFGTAFQWSRTEYHLSSGEAADCILAIIKPGLMPYLEPVEAVAAK